ncbi:MAG TPA: hypothetical protein VK683_00765 [Rhizomicrobium sp.]|jgi:hypothetical protein|nr:hypothetical protein [Rhizomicrobium sp.]
MKFPISAALLAAITLTALSLPGRAGPEGNPNGQPYANEPGGTMAVKPATLGTVTYDPYGSPAPFADMQAGQAAINPPPPLPVPPMPVPNPPLRPR